MNNTIKFKIDGKEIITENGKTVVEAAHQNGVYIPTLCNFPGSFSKGSCRMCTIKVNNRFMTSCTTPAAPGMEVESNTPEINEFRKSIIELLFVSGNHFCPSCEKSGNCELQALAYRYQMMVPRYPYSFPLKKVDASNPKIIKDQNRCVICQRCMKTIKTEKGEHYFAYLKRGNVLEVVMDKELGKEMTDELAKLAMENCPVGSIIYKEVGFVEPIGTRKYDKQPIGSDIDV
ncbi:MAG: (2Fe-2S)-binding protein [Bacteroidetes bacterium]|nr:(2Fe-2S)-binding protein [Bacteroidota bacterium]MBL6942972.1 (2Fe-2S)-binding protein [Bacteroidales bacterium]